MIVITFQLYSGCNLREGKGRKMGGLGSVARKGSWWGQLGHPNPERWIMLSAVVKHAAVLILKIKRGQKFRAPVFSFPT